MNLAHILWERLTRSPGLVVDPRGPTATHTPTNGPQSSEAREPVNDADHARTALHVEHRRWAMDYVCQQANAIIVRDYGRGPVIEKDSYNGMVVELPSMLSPAEATPERLEQEVLNVADVRAPDEPVLNIYGEVRSL